MWGYGSGVYARGLGVYTWTLGEALYGLTTEGSGGFLATLMVPLIATLKGPPKSQARNCQSSALPR